MIVQRITVTSMMMMKLKQTLKIARNFLQSRNIVII